MYIKVWYECTNAISAPNLDLQFVKYALMYGDIDIAVSEKIISKMKSHLWYLSPEVAALAFFDPTVTVDEKINMINQLKAENKDFGAKAYFRR